jgi:hypothetical protein
VPPPRTHGVRYAGVFGATHHWRARVVPPPPAPDPDAMPVGGHAHESEAAREHPPTHRCRYRPWSELLRRAFKIDVEKCDRCGARMKLRSLVTSAASIERYLRHIGEPIDLPTLAPARDPPFFKSRVLRRKLRDFDHGARAQQAMFA